jgi:hypothetical protein
MRPYKQAHSDGRYPDQGRSPEVLASEPAPLFITSGPMLCRLRLWSETQWAALPEPERPAQFVHAPGLGWVGAVPIVCMN